MRGVTMRVQRRDGSAADSGNEDDAPDPGKNPHGPQSLTSGRTESCRLSGKGL
jgi:hypothetical protein